MNRKQLKKELSILNKKIKYYFTYPNPRKGYLLRALDGDDRKYSGTYKHMWYSGVTVTYIKKYIAPEFSRAMIHYVLTRELLNKSLTSIRCPHIGKVVIQRKECPYNHNRIYSKDERPDCLYIHHYKRMFKDYVNLNNYLKR